MKRMCLVPEKDYNKIQTLIFKVSEALYSSQPIGDYTTEQRMDAIVAVEEIIGIVYYDDVDNSED